MRTKRKNVCQECRARKLACDGKLPECSQCALRQIRCSGYHQEFLFVAPASSAPKEQCGLGGGSGVVISIKEEKCGVSKLRSKSSPTGLSGTSISLEATVQDLDKDIAFIVQHYASIGGGMPAVFDPFHNQICGAWVEVLPLFTQSATEKQFLFSAITTWATALRHHVDTTKECRSKVLEMYGDALRHMGKALGNQVTFQVEHCIAIMCLAATDIVIPNSGSGWTTHAKGVGGLMERLGPKPFSAGVLHRMFIGFRPLLLISAILDRRSLFLERREWVVAPFHDRPLSIMQSMLNEATKLPGLLQEYDDLVHCRSVPSVAAVEQLQEQFSSVLEDLENWERVSASQAPFALSFPQPSPSSSITDRNAIWFPNMTVASSLTHCWAFRIIAKMHRDELDTILATAKKPEQQTHQRRSPHFTANAESVSGLAQRICNSMPFFLEPEMKLYGPASTFFTFRTAMRVFQSERYRCEARLERCRQIIARMASVGVHFASL